MIPEPTEADLDLDLASLYAGGTRSLRDDDILLRLLRRCHAAERERDDLRIREREVTCVWCGHQFKSTLQSQAQHLYEHAKVCEKHPIHAAESQLAALRAEVERLKLAIRTHREQKADDRCIEDDDRLYAALGDGVKCDRRVGDKDAMLKNCERFITNRCEGGGWPTYAELEAEVERLRADLARPVSKEGRAMNRRKGRMMQASELKQEIEEIMAKFGDTCCYVTGLAWGSVALWQQADVDERAALIAKEPAHAD